MPCNPPKSNADKLWSNYDEYYQGERDNENRKNGIGLHHWSGAKSLEWYKGHMLRDTMHGYGDYRWRYLGANHTAVTYEGRFYNNMMHGYGVMSYPDGHVYTGLFYNNVRWGPGVMSHAALREDVGLWYGNQLMRLAWRPNAPSAAIDLASTPVGRNLLTPHRILLTSQTKTIGSVNSALELLKQYGSDPIAATDKWTKLYPKNCTDTDSQLCQVEVFDRAYHDIQIETLVEIGGIPDKDIIQGEQVYYAWNNNEMMLHMMKHCYKHDYQRNETNINLTKVLSGNRHSFKTAGKHEIDCRTLLMASYLGHISNVAQLVNESDVNPNVSDIQGNSALMYAACGDQPDIIHFLAEAGADIDGYNDACCTPLGVTLLRFALMRWDIAPNGMVQALMPPTPPPPPTEEIVSEWNIKRDLATNTSPVSSTVQRIPSKSKPASLIPSKNISAKNLNGLSKYKLEIKEIDEDNEERRVYKNITEEYLVRINETFSATSGVNPIPYLFHVYDMSKDVDLNEEENKKSAEKSTKKAVVKVPKDTIMNASRDMTFQSYSKENQIPDMKEQMIQDKVSRVMLTILQLLTEGADPRKVRCPQPSLFIATVASSSDMVNHLVRHGADVNEVYPMALDYTCLDIAVSRPLTFDNLEVIRSLLQNGARTDHRLTYSSPSNINNGPETRIEDGPTLLHAILTKQVDSENEEEIRRQVLELLLQYGCDPIATFKGHSAMDTAMSLNINIFDIFIKNRRTNLNAVINDLNQTILVKMFYLPYCRTVTLTERLQMLTNLLLFGADPLIKCQNGTEKYDNLFDYARQVLAELETPRKAPSPTGNIKKSKSEIKGKKADKSKKDPSLKSGASKPTGKVSADEQGDYKQALDLVIECARLLHIRWLQAKLMKELIVIVDKYKHRQWNLILKEHKNKKSAGLWLTAVRCLEIWEILKMTKKKIYNNDRILKHVLCIVHYCHNMTRNMLKNKAMTSHEKALIESEVTNILREHKLATMSTPDIVPAIRPYVTPELIVKGLEKFNVCFECALPLSETNVRCSSCKLIAFCSLYCMKINIDRTNCHPCSEYLKGKYFTSPVSFEETETADD